MKKALMVLTAAAVFGALPPRTRAQPDPGKDQKQIAALAADLRADVAGLDKDTAQVRADRRAVRQALLAYLAALKGSGPGGPQAQAAEAALDSAQKTLHAELGVRRAAVKDVLGNLRKLIADKLDYDRDIIKELGNDIKKDSEAIDKDHAAVIKDREAVRDELAAYVKAAAQNGPDSAQAKAADAALVSGQAALDGAIGAREAAVAEFEKDREELAAERKDLDTDRNAAKFSDRLDDLIVRLEKLSRELAADTRRIVRDRVAVHGAREGYLAAVQKYGKDSSQAQTTLAELDKAERGLHEELRDRGRELKAVEKDHRTVERLARVERRDLKTDHKK